MNLEYRILILIFLSVTLSAFGLKAQNKISDDKIAVVILESGTKLEGEIINWRIDESITLAMAWGDTLTFMQGRIKSISQKSALKAKRADYNFNETGIYYNIRTHLITGNEGNRANGVFGMGVSVSSGYRFNRFIGLGMGVGFDQYIWDSGEQLVPVFAEVTGFLNESNTSIYYNLQLGYAFASEDQDYGLTDAKGGWMIYPNAGIRWGAQDVKFMFGAGYKFQDAQFTYSSPWNFGERSVQDLLYKRLCINLGITL